MNTTTTSPAGAPGGPPMTPQGLLQMHMAMGASRVLSAAVQHALFSHIASGHENVAAIAAAAGTDPRATRMLLDALVALGLLGKADGQYRLTPASRAYLVRESPDYVGALMEIDDLWHAWSGLPEVVRSGRPSVTVELQAQAEAFFPTLIRSLHVLNRAPARRLAAALGLGTRHRGLRILDIGAGSAVWSIALAEADAGAHVTAQDYPGVLKETAGFVTRHGLGARFDYLAGDLNAVDFGSARFDLAVLGNIVHSEGEASSRRLFRRLHAALAPGGRLAILDFFPDEDRSGPAPAMLFALNMLVSTENGDTYTLSEYRAWLAEAGFASVETVEIGEDGVMPAPAVVATKA